MALLTGFCFLAEDAVAQSQKLSTKVKIQNVPSQQKAYLKKEKTTTTKKVDMSERKVVRTNTTKPTSTQSTTKNNPFASLKVASYKKPSNDRQSILQEIKDMEEKISKNPNDEGLKQKLQELKNQL